MATENQFNGIGLVFARQDIGEFFHRSGRHGHVVNTAGVAAVEMGMGGKVRAVAGWLPLNVHLFDQPAGDEGFEAVIDRGHGDGGHAGFGAGVDLIGRGMIPLIKQHAEDGLPLGGGPLTSMVQGRGQRLFIFLSEPFHGSEEDELE